MLRVIYHASQTAPSCWTPLAQYGDWRLYPPVGMAGPDAEQESSDIPPYPAPVIDRACQDAFWKCNSDCWNRYPMQRNRINKCVTETCLPLCASGTAAADGEPRRIGGGWSNAAGDWRSLISAKNLAMAAIGLAVVVAVVTKNDVDRRTR